jgi:hypothetical protein
MNGYTKIFLVSILLISFSIISETYFPFVNNSKPSTFEYLHIYFIRFIHYLIYLFATFYLIFFSGIGKKFDRYLYLTFAAGILFAWYIFDSCWLSYSELLFYNIDLENTITTFHPTFTSIYGNYTSYFTMISGGLSILTTCILLMNLEINYIYKSLFLILFLFLSIRFLYQRTMITLYYSAKKNKQLHMLKTIYDKYRSFMKNH